ncbi:MAG: PspC domain-containing protein [Limisphaerales bacterium]
MKLRRSRHDCILAGVCGGIARWLGWPSFRVRLAYVVVSVLSAAFPGIIAYLVLWFLMPKEDAA